MEDYDCGDSFIFLAHGVVVMSGRLLRRKYEAIPGNSAPRSLRIIVLLQAWDLPMHGSASYFIKITQSESH